MSRNRTQIKGLKDLEKQLVRLQKMTDGKEAVKVLRPAVRAAMKPVLDDIKANTPIDSGELQAASKLRIGKPTKKMLRSQHFKNTTVIAGRAGWFWSSPDAGMWNRALAIEFGTENQAQQAVLRNAFDKNKSFMIKEFSKVAGAQIEKAMVKHYKQKGGA